MRNTASSFTSGIPWSRSTASARRSGAAGCSRRSWASTASSGEGLLAEVQEQWSRARGRLDLSRPRQPSGRAIDGAGDDALNRLIRNPVSNMFDEEKIEKLQVGYSYDRNRELNQCRH